MDDLQRILRDDSLSAESSSFPPPLKSRGRPVGTKNRKRKAVEDLSQNLHTIKSRRYTAALEAYDPLKARLRKAYNADLSAVSTARSKVKKTDRFKSASSEEQEKILQEVKNICFYKR